MNKNLIILAQASATFLRAAADAITSLLGDPPASPEAAASPEPEPPKKTRGKAKAVEQQPETSTEATPEPKQATPVSTPTEETTTVYKEPKLEVESTEARHARNQALIFPLHDARKGLFIKEVVQKLGATSLKDLPADKQAEFEAEIQKLKEEHLPAKAAGPADY